MVNGLEILNFMKDYGSDKGIHIGLNTSTLTDIWTGSFVKNKEGVWYMNGGVYPIMGLAGNNNTQKTGKAVYDMARILFRFSKSIIIYYDSESTLDLERFARMVDGMFGIEGYFEDNILNKRFFYMPACDDLDGTALHNRIKELYENFAALKNSKDKNERAQYESMKFNTPIWNEKTQSYIQGFGPVMVVCDSITEVSFDKLAFKQFEEGDIDAGGKKRTRDLEVGNLRRVLMEDTCRLGPRVGISSYWIAQTAGRFSMDGKPLEKETTHIRQDKKISAPKMMMKAPHLGIEILKGTVLKNPKTGEILYPSRNSGTILDAKLNPDLLDFTTSVYRNKMGASGARPGWLGSQREGIKEELSMYHIIKQAGYYGLEGSKEIHACSLYPDVTIRRTTVYDLVEDDKRLGRAIGLVYQLWFMQSFWGKLPKEFRIEPSELYQLVKDQGHDWNELLDTVDFYHDNPEFIKQPTLTIYELLEIAVNKKPIYWKA